MELQNKRISDEEFARLRQEVLTQWPTGKDVDLEEAVAYHKAMPVYRKFGKKLLDAKRDVVDNTDVERLENVQGHIEFRDHPQVIREGACLALL